MEATPAFVELVTTAHAYLSARQEGLRARFRLGEWGRWDWSQSTGQLIFSESEGGPPRVVATFQFVGSVSTRGGTWLWGWANPDFERRLTADIAKVVELGEARGIPQLTTPEWKADEVDGWEMTAIAAYVLEAVGAYRTPGDNGFAYFVLTSIRWAHEDEKIDCRFHGEQDRTLVCRHIVDSLYTRAAVGFHWSEDDTAPRPDAWCSECSRAYGNAGDWTEEVLTFADLQVLCGGCYDVAKGLWERARAADGDVE